MIKGNKTRLGMSLTGRDSIITKFEERFVRRHVWLRFKNKIDISRKAYIKVKKLTHNRTELIYDAMGRLEMSDAWWDDRIKEWPGARKYKTKTIPNMDMFEAEFGGVTVTGAEGWSAQQGEASLDSRVDAEKDEDESDSVDTDMPAPRTGTSRAGCSRSKRKRKEVVQEFSYDVRNAILANKNKIAEKMLHVLENDHAVVERNHKCCVDYVVEVLNELPGVIKWSPFHIAALNHLKTAEENRQAFVAFLSDDDKISYLEHSIGVKIYGGL